MSEYIKRKFLKTRSFFEHQVTFWAVTIFLHELECCFFVRMAWISVVVQNSKTVLDNISQPFIKTRKGTF